MDDEVVGDLTKEDLLKLGFSTGNAIKFLKAFATISAAPKAAVEDDAVTMPSSSDDPYALFVAAYGGSLAPMYPDQLLAAVRETTFAIRIRISHFDARFIRRRLGHILNCLL